MTEFAPIEQLAKWLNQKTNPSSSDEIIARVKEYVLYDVQELLGEEGKVAISVTEQDEYGKPQLFVDQVFPWNFDDIDLEQSRKVIKLSSLFVQRVQAPLLHLRMNGIIGIHSWSIYNDCSEEDLIAVCGKSRIYPFVFSDDGNVELGKKGPVERFLGLVSPRILRIVS